jgi:hypothetical protein
MNNLKTSTVNSPQKIVFSLLSLVLSALLIGSITISGCGKTAETTGAGAGGNGSSGDIITISGTVELNASDAQQIGLSTQSISTHSVGTLSLVKANGNGKVYLYRQKFRSSKSSGTKTKAEGSTDTTTSNLSLDYEKVTDTAGNPITAEIKTDGTYNLSCPSEKIKDLSQAVVSCEIAKDDKVVIQSSLVTIPKETKKIEANIDPITTYALASIESTLTSQLGSLFSSLGEAGLLLDSTKELVSKIVSLVMETINAELAKTDGSLKSENLSMIANKTDVKENYVRPIGKFEDKIQEITSNEKINNLADVYEAKVQKEFKAEIYSDEKKYTEFREKYKDFDPEEFQKYDKVKSKEMFIGSGGGAATKMKDDFFADMNASYQYQITFADFFAEVVKNPLVDTLNNKQVKYGFDLTVNEMLTHLNNMIKTTAEKMLKDDWGSLASVEMGVVPLIEDAKNPPQLKAEEKYNIDRLMMLSGPMNAIQDAAYVEKKKTRSPSLMYYDPQKIAAGLGFAGISSMPPAVSTLPGMDTMPTIPGMPSDGSTTTPSPSMPTMPTIPTIPTMPPTMSYAQNDFISYSYINFQKYYSSMTSTTPPSASAGAGSSITAPITSIPPTSGTATPPAASTPTYTPPAASTPIVSTPPTTGTGTSGSDSNSSMNMDKYGSGSTTPPTGFSYATTPAPSYSYSPPTTSYYNYSAPTGSMYTEGSSMYSSGGSMMAPMAFSAYQDPAGEMVIFAEANLNIANASEKTVKVELQEDGTAIAELKERKWDEFYKTMSTQSTNSSSSKNYVLDPYSGDKKITPKIGKVYKIAVNIADAKGNKTTLTGEEKRAFFVDREFLPDISVQYNQNTGKLNVKVSDRNNIITNLLKEAKLTDAVTHWRATVYDITAGKMIVDNWNNWESKKLFLLGEGKEFTVKGVSDNTNITVTVEISTIKDGYIANSLYTTQGFMDSINNHVIKN